MTNGWNKFTLLIWKNWTLQKRHKLRTAVEILSPVIFVSLLVLVRSLVEPTKYPVQEYDAFSAKTFIIDGKSILASNCTKLPKYKFSYSPYVEINKTEPIRDLIEESLHYMLRTELKNTFSREVNRSNIIQTMKGCIQNIQSIISNTSCKPSQNMLDCLIDTMIEIKGYNTSKDMERQLIDPAQSDTSMCGIQFDDSLKDALSGDGIWPNHTTLTLRFPAQLRKVMIMNSFFNWKTNFLYPVYQVPGPRTTMQKSNKSEKYGGWPSYVHEGFMPVAHSIFHEITKLKTKETGPNLFIQRFPHPAYLKDDLIPVLQSFISLIIMLTFNYTCINTVKSIAVEKEKQLKEVMKIMGLSNWLHWTAWFVKSFLYLLVSSILIVLLLKIQWYQTKEGVSGYSVFTYTPWHLLLFFMVMYITTMIFFCFMISTFFSKANTAATMAGLLWFVSYFPYSCLSTAKILPKLTTRLLSCLSINTAMGFGFEIILMNEATAEGLQWNKLFTPLNVYDHFVMGHVILMFALDSIIYLVIALYVEQVFPGSYGVPQPWYFLITKDYWRSICKNIRDVEDVPNNYEASMNNMIEPDPKGLKVGINIVNLSKMYDKKMAVEKLNLKIFEDQITVLLGHNGAGKTTTMSMLTGMFPPTSGTAVVAGYDIRRDIEGVRDSLGLCSQHNVLFSDLTVAEHIYFYARLKGISGSALNEQVNRYVNLLGLDKKRNIVSSSLSGGMQRRLSVGTALCGGSRVVLLDEPSSGMDPSARRELWDLLHLEKKGRTMILTTHFMDEAEILGERVAILSDGKLRCVGSPFYLKKMFGIGYRLTVARQPLSPTRSIGLSAPITNLLTTYVPSVKLYTDIGSEISYILPEEKSHEFEPMLRDLEDKQEELHLSGFGITASTLEEVFMRVGADNCKHNDEDLISNRSETNNIFIEDTSTLSNTVVKYEGYNLIINQWKAMFIKKFLVSLRSWLLHLLLLILPVFFLSMAIIISRMWSDPVELPSRVLDLSETYQDSVTLLSTTQDMKHSNLTVEYEKYFKDANIDQMKLVNIDSDNMTAYYLKQAAVDMPSMRVKNVAGVSFKSNKVTAWFSNFPYHDLPVSVMLAQNAILKSYSPESSFTLVNHPLPFTITSRFEMLMYGNGGTFQISFNIGLGMAFVSSFYLLFYIKENVTKSKLLQLASGVAPITMWSVAFIWDMLWFMIISISVCITLIAFQQEGLSTASEIGRVFLVLMIFGWGMLPFQYIVSTRFTTPSTGFSRMCFFNFFTGLASFLIIEVLYAPGLDLENIADILHKIFMIFPHYSLCGAVKNLNQASVTLQTCLKFCEIMMPNQYCTQQTVCSLNIKSCCISDNPYFEWNKAGIGKHLTYMILTGIILYCVLLFKEYKIHNIVMKKLNKFDVTPPPIDSASEDDDVAAERERINNLLPEEYYKYNLLCNNLSKYYEKFLAVNQLSIGVKDECFGLLGINGAGKTTTFKMLTGDLQISSGAAWVKGFSVNTQMERVYQNIGYCPQFDALLDEMTGRETLEMYSLIRGIPKWRQDCFIADISKKLGFTKHLDKKVGQYSGGNKRKLSTSIALLGEPQVVYLDEPTTGMDPAAKRLVWNAIAGCRCVILTSHSMEECEALCSKLAIMVNGQPQCLGSPQHLKNKFSQGYTLIIKLRRSTPVQNEIDSAYPDIILNPSSNTTLERSNSAGVTPMFDFTRLDRFLKSKFSDAKMIETYQGLITYHLPYAGIRWSTIFGVMEMGKEELNIEDYSIGQTSLEQIFLQFTKNQKATKDD